MTRHISILIALSLSSITVSAGNILLDDPTDATYNPSPEEEWREAEVKLPEQINRDALQAFEVGAGEQRFEYLIDSSSLHTGADGVTRYLLVIRSRSGVENSSYEGIRCGERLHKVYAYGDGNKLYPSPGNDWQHIHKDESTDYRAALYDDMLCNLQNGTPNDPDDVINAMRAHRQVSE
ncbi:MAG: CNP1-like family protein [Candidatus Thiodiazotropha sp.]